MTVNETLFEEGLKVLIKGDYAIEITDREGILRSETLILRTDRTNNKIGVTNLIMDGDSLVFSVVHYI